MIILLNTSQKPSKLFESFLQRCAVTVLYLCLLIGVGFISATVSETLYKEEWERERKER